MNPITFKKQLEQFQQLDFFIKIDAINMYYMITEGSPCIIYDKKRELYYIDKSKLYCIDDNYSRSDANVLSVSRDVIINLVYDYIKYFIDYDKCTKLLWCARKIKELEGDLTFIKTVID